MPKGDIAWRENFEKMRNILGLTGPSFYYQLAMRFWGKLPKSLKTTVGENREVLISRFQSWARETGQSELVAKLPNTVMKKESIVSIETSPSPPSEMVSVDMLQKTTRFVEEVGGLDVALRLLNIVAEISRVRRGGQI